MSVMKMRVAKRKQTVKKRSRRLSESVIAEALRECFGNITAAAESLKCDRPHLSIRVSNSEVLKKARNEGLKRIADVAQGALVKRIEAGDTTAIIFALKTMGRERGFYEGPQNVNAIQVNNSNTIEEQKPKRDVVNDWRETMKRKLNLPQEAETLES